VSVVDVQVKGVAEVVSLKKGTMLPSVELSPIGTPPMVMMRASSSTLTLVVESRLPSVTE
jgi:hypothetical protein